MSDTAADIINDLRERADKLDNAVGELELYRCLMAELDRRTAPPQPALPLSTEQVEGVKAIRAALLRSALGLAVAVLEGPGNERAGTDRASIGRIVHIIGNADNLVGTLGRRGSVLNAEKLNRVRDQYAELREIDALQRLRQLRHIEIGHQLILDPPESHRADLHEVANDIKRLVPELHDGLGMGAPLFSSMGDRCLTYAKVHWDTYLASVEGKNPSH